MAGKKKSAVGKYLRAFAVAWPERKIVQASLAQLSWRQKVALIEKLADSDDLQFARGDAWANLY